MTEKQTTAGKILRMIENVSPDDTAKLDEIDARVWCYIKKKEYFKKIECWHWFKGESIPFRCGDDYTYDFPVPHRYTRSRDALKRIRPEGWSFSEIRKEEIGYSCRFWKKGVGSKIGYEQRTEELAELSAIISAIAHERSQP